jgi:hypothetical protein
MYKYRNCIEIVYTFGKYPLTKGKPASHQGKPATGVIYFTSGYLYIYFELCKTGDC